MADSLKEYRKKRDFRATPVPLSDQPRDGHVTVRLEGERLTGGYSLKRIAKGKEERSEGGPTEGSEGDAARRGEGGDA